MSMITYQTDVHSKVSRRMRTDRKVPFEIRKKKRRSFLPAFITLYNGTDNPNNEQKLMVNAFIKSSNALFKSEVEVLDDKMTGLEDSVGAYPSKMGLYKSHMENSAKVDMDSSPDKVIHSGRMKRYLFLDKVGTIRPLDHVRYGHGVRRCDRVRDTNRMCLPKDRILRSRQSDLTGGIYTNGLHLSPKFKRRLRSTYNGRRGIYNRRYLNSKFDRFKNSLKGSDSGEVEDNTSKKMFPLSNPDSNLKNSQSMVEKESEKSRKTLFKKRSDTFVPGECGNPKIRSRCSKPVPTVIVKSINIGRTGRICFPSTHRCMKSMTCPCSVAYRKCPSRTTCCMRPETLCFEEHEITRASTLGRCHGIDTETPTPIGEGMCPVTPYLEKPKKKRKRCACDCGCGCPHNLRRNHPGRPLAKGVCGCGCGCGCLHAGGHTGKPLT